MECSYHPLSLLISDYIPSISDFFPFCFTEVRGQLHSPMMDSQKKCHRVLYWFLALTSEAPFNCKTLCFTYYPSLVFTRDAGESMWWEVQTADKCLLSHTAQNHLKQNLAFWAHLLFQKPQVLRAVLLRDTEQKQSDVDLCFAWKEGFWQWPVVTW